MTEREPVAEQTLINDTAVTPWADARERLENHERGRTYWLATVRPDGRPHLVPILGLWSDGAFDFITGEATRKGRNLTGDPRCAIAVSSTVLPSLDVVIEGDARNVTAEATLQRVAMPAVRRRRARGAVVHRRFCLDVASRDDRMTCLPSMSTADARQGMARPVRAGSGRPSSSDRSVRSGQGATQERV